MDALSAQPLYPLLGCTNSPEDMFEPKSVYFGIDKATNRCTMYCERKRAITDYSTRISRCSKVIVRAVLVKNLIPPILVLAVLNHQPNESSSCEIVK